MTPLNFNKIKEYEKTCTRANIKLKGNLKSSRALLTSQPFNVFCLRMHLLKWEVIAAWKIFPEAGRIEQYCAEGNTFFKMLQARIVFLLNCSSLRITAPS